MKASDVMVRNVVTVSPEERVPAVAKILLQNCLSAVPVVTERGKLVGIVSEGDLLQRPKPGTEARRLWWRDLFGDNGSRAAEFAKSHSRKVSDVMTREVVTAKPDTPVGDIATLLMQHSIEWVPILRRGKLIGIVSRANLVEAFARNDTPQGVGGESIPEKLPAGSSGACQHLDRAGRSVACGGNHAGRAHRPT